MATQSSRARPSLRPLSVCCALLSLACGPSDPSRGETSRSEPPRAAPGDEPRRPDVLLVVVDTLRADGTSLYGNPRPTTPHLEQLAGHATVHRRARATSPWTLPSHASLFTGLYPFEHGARNYALEQRTGSFDPAAALAPEHTTLAEVLSEDGYRTGGFAANRVYLARKYGLAQGFDTYHVATETAAEVNARAQRWLEEVAITAAAPRAPFFLFLNYIDCHRPYQCAPSDGFPFVGTQQESVQLLEELRDRILDERQPAAPEKLARLRAQYENAVRNVDEALGSLFDHLRERGLYDDTLIVVTSDHGLFFDEHGLIEHGMDVYDAVLDVPLVVKAPGQTERRDDGEWISLVHLPGTILSHIDQTSAPAAGLLRHWPRGAVLAEKYYGRRVDMRLAIAERLRRVRQALFAEDWKLIRSSDGELELYDLESDPAELENRAADETLTAERLAGLVEELLSRTGPGAATGAVPEAVELDAADIEAMRALGYAE